MTFCVNKTLCITHNMTVVAYLKVTYSWITFKFVKTYFCFNLQQWGKTKHKNPTHTHCKRKELVERCIQSTVIVRTPSFSCKNNHTQYFLIKQLFSIRVTRTKSGSFLKTSPGMFFFLDTDVFASQPKLKHAP